MNTLEFGLDLTGAEQGRLHTHLAADGDRTGDTIEHLDSLMEGAVPLGYVPHLEEYDARWHPSGFMVFSLGYAPNGLGTRRLHIWPAGLRQREDRGLGKMDEGEWDADIHNHAWQVTSLNMAGYQDKIIEVQAEGNAFTPEDAIITKNPVFTAEEVATKGLFWRFRPWYNEDGQDALVNTGHCVSVSTIEHRNDIMDSDIHIIDPWVYHVPTIPEDTFAATLVVNSHRVLEPNFPYDEELDGDEPWGQPDILIRGATEPIVGARREATRAEKLLAKYQLVERLSQPPYDFAFPLRGVLDATRKELLSITNAPVRS